MRSKADKAKYAKMKWHKAAYKNWNYSFCLLFSNLLVTFISASSALNGGQRG